MDGHVCHICNKNFTRKYNFDDHMRIHTGEQRFQCSKCSRRFNNKNNYEKHLEIHEERKVYHCEYCNNYYVSMDGFKKHLAGCQQNPNKAIKKTVQCEICGTHVVTEHIKDHLAVHEAKEKGTTIYHCEHCPDEKFFHRMQLSRHRNKYHAK